jgi:CheY-like chemotaxis protein
MSKTPHICLVEDYPDSRVLIAAVLQSAGMEVSVAEDGTALNQLLQSGVEPDLFLLDLSLPGEDGVTILHRLRDDPRWKGRPILALTAHAMAGDAERGLALGFDGYLTKPIDVGNLSAIIRGYLQHDEGAAGAS